MSFEAFDNESIALGGGAGIQSAQFVASRGAKAVITGNCGPNAVRTLSAAGIELFLGQSGTVKDVIDKYKSGDLRSTKKANVSDHYGMGNADPTEKIPEQNISKDSGTSPGMGMGRGRGMGRGMGLCGGKGSGRGIIMPAGQNACASASGVQSGKQELASLKEEAAVLKKQMEKIEKRIKSLEDSN
jgi:predicted Fe-Mo cluster-binding NifX family protein